MAIMYVVNSITCNHSSLTVLLDYCPELKCERTSECREYFGLTLWKQYSQDLCGKTVTVTANGKTTQATIKDLVSVLCTWISFRPTLYLLQCPEGGGNCHWGDMDMSPGLFTFFNPLTVGKFEIQWDFTDGSAPPAPPPQDPSPYVEPPVPTTPTQDPVPVVEPSPNTNTPIIDSLPVYENAVQYDDETPVVEGPIPTPTADYVEPTPTPWTETTDCTTTTESSSAAPTPTPPTFAEQIAIAMKEHDVNGLGAVLVELGNIFQGSTDTTTTDTATTTTTTY